MKVKGVKEDMMEIQLEDVSLLKILGSKITTIIDMVINQVVQVALRKEMVIMEIVIVICNKNYQIK